MTAKERDRILDKIDSLIKKASHECTMSGNTDAKRYLNRLKKWMKSNKN